MLEIITAFNDMGFFWRTNDRGSLVEYTVLIFIFFMKNVSVLKVLIKLR